LPKEQGKLKYSTKSPQGERDLKVPTEVPVRPFLLGEVATPKTTSLQKLRRDYIFFCHLCGSLEKKIVKKDQTLHLWVEEGILNIALHYFSFKILYMQET